MNKFKVGVVGATGMVGQRFVSLLEKVLIYLPQPCLILSNILAKIGFKSQSVDWLDLHCF